MAAQAPPPSSHNGGIPPNAAAEDLSCPPDATRLAGDSLPREPEAVADDLPPPPPPLEDLPLPELHLEDLHLPLEEPDHPPPPPIEDEGSAVLDSVMPAAREMDDIICPEVSPSDPLGTEEMDLICPEVGRLSSRPESPGMLSNQLGRAGSPGLCYAVTK